MHALQLPEKEDFQADGMHMAKFSRVINRVGVVLLWGRISWTAQGPGHFRVTRTSLCGEQRDEWADSEVYKVEGE
jgi:hypothetical protein